jgi:hypothetical protein
MPYARAGSELLVWYLKFFVLIYSTELDFGMFKFFLVSAGFDSNKGFNATACVIK